MQPLLSLGPAAGRIVAALVAAACLDAQCTPQPIVRAGNTLPGVSGTVASMVPWDPDGPGPQPAGIVASGFFRLAGDAIVGNVARLDPATGGWSPLGALPSTPWLGTIVVSPQNLLYVLAPPYVRRWTGSTWMPVAAVPAQTAVFAVLGNGDLVFGGSFVDVAGVPANGLARFDGTAWHDLGLGPSSNVRDLRMLGNGDLAIAGDLIAPGTFAATGFATWNSGTLAFPPGAPAQVATLAEYPNGDVLAVTLPQQLLLRWNGAAWTNVTTTPAFDVREVAIAGNGDVYVGGGFGTFAGIAASSIARLHNGTWSALGIGVQGPVGVIVPWANGELVVGGSFGVAGGRTALHVARWDGAAWAAIGPGIAGLINTMLPLPGDSLVVGGNIPLFTDAAGVVTSHVARRSNGLWHNLGGGTDGYVMSLARLANGDLVAGGAFATAGGVPCNRIARWTGQAWLPFGSGMSGFVHALAAMPNGDVVAGGYFGTAGGVSAPNLARWNGSAWSSLGAFDGGVEALLLLANGDLVAGGPFTSIGGQPFHGVARFDGTAWQPMGAGVAGVRGLTLARGAVHARNGFGLWRWDGAAWQSLPDLGLGVATAFGRSPGDDLVVAFNRAVRRFDGTSWSVVADLTTASNLFANGAWATASDAGGQLWLGGGFAGAQQPGGGEIASPMLVAVESSCPATAFPYGAGCVGSAGLVQLQNLTLPWAGATWRARATGIPASSPLAIGVLGPWFGAPLQGVVPQGLPGCTLYPLPLPELLQVLPASGGVAEQAFAIPPALALVGAQLVAQVVPVEFGAGGAITAFTSSNALDLTIGGF